MDSTPKSLKEINLKVITQAQGPYFPSPAAWEDEVLYFLLVDRFSDGREYGGFKDIQGNPVGPQGGRTTELFSREDAGSAERNTWFENGKKWCGGNLKGLQDKLGYLKRLGITAIWLSPIFKQTAKSQSYHGYGIQNFLDVDPHYGTREDLRELVQAAHGQGIRVILDIILNHAGNVFAYKNGVNYDYFNGTAWPVGGYKMHEGDNEGSLPFEVIDLDEYPHAWPDGAIWPREFQHPDTWTRKGKINSWDKYPEYSDGDFFSLKDIQHGQGIKDPALAWDLLKRIKDFKKTETLAHLGKVFCYWIAYADIDGFRLDTVKHMEPGAVRYFTNVIHEFAQSIGKENFYVIGEITGGRSNAVSTVDATGLDAALGIDDIQDKLEFLAKGYRSPGNPDSDHQEGYFDLFTNSLVDGKNTHQWYSKRIVTMFDDHDQVGTQYKFRFCGSDLPDIEKRLNLAAAINLTTIGIPCTYYGTEQAFNGADWRASIGVDAYSDTFLRECMFGGPFGSYLSTNKHFFNEEHPAYRFMQDICTLRKEHLALRRGRQYLRQVSASGIEGAFYYPTPINGELRWAIAWSRIFAEQEYVCAINTDMNKDLKVWVTVDRSLHKEGDIFTCLYPQPPHESIVEKRNGAAIQITIPAGGFVLYYR